MFHVFCSFLGAALLCVACCPSATQGVIPLPPVPIRSDRSVQIQPQPPAPPVPMAAIGEVEVIPCREGIKLGEYGCRPGDFCPNLVGDVRTKSGYHVITVGKEIDGSHFVHVADTCQHYICNVDMACVSRGGTDVECMVPTGCLLVHELGPDDPAS